MANNSRGDNSVKTSWINVEVSAPIIGFIALPMIFLIFCGIHNFENDFFTITLTSLTAIIVLVFIYLVIFKPENLTIDGKGHLTIKRDQEKRKIGGETEE